MVAMADREEMIVAVRHQGGWDIAACLTEGEERFEKRMAALYPQRECRLIARHPVRDVSPGFVRDSIAPSHGWHYCADEDTWIPMGEPLPPLPGEPQQSGTILLKEGNAVTRGGFPYAIVLTERDAVLGSVIGRHDSMATWIGFTDLLSKGGNPHARLSSFGPAHVIIQPGRTSTECRFFANVLHGPWSGIIDVYTSRNALADQFRKLLITIAVEYGKHLFAATDHGDDDREDQAY
jgi:hypothetical protein